MGSENKDKIGDCSRGLAVPPAMKNVVQDLKEAINCTDYSDQEIYAVLQECDMDPDRAVEMLLAQDTFQEVKSKRQRRKKMKEAIDSRPRRHNVYLSRGGKISSEHNVLRGSTHELGKATEKGEVGSVCPSVTSSMTCVIGQDLASDSFRTDNRQQSLESAGVSSRLQPTLLGVSKGHLSMADIVRMGKPSRDAISHHSKAPGVSASTKPESSLSLHDYDQTHQEGFNHEWPVIEQPVVGYESYASKLSALSSVNVPPDQFNPPSNKDSLLKDCVSDEAEVPLWDISSDNVDSDKIKSDFQPSRHATMNNTGLASHSNYNLRNTSSASSHSSSDHTKDVSLAASDIQQLSLIYSKLEALSTENKSALVIPSHIRGSTDKCPHLSFGSFNSGSNLKSSAMLASHASNRDLEMKAAAVDGGLLAQNLDSSNAVYRGDILLGRDVFKAAAIDKKDDFLSSFQQELARRTSPEATISHEHTTMSSIADPSFQKSQWMSNSNPLPFRRPLNMSTFSREMVMEPGLSPPKPQRSALLEDLRVQTFQQLELDDKRGYHPQTQNHQYLPPVVQQGFSESSAYGHSLAEGMKYSHPHNGNEFTMSTLTPGRGTDAFSYQNPGSCNPGSLLPNSPVGPMIPSSNFNDILPSEYTIGRNGRFIQQHGGSSTRDYGLVLRSVPLPESMHRASLEQPHQQALPQYMTPEYSDLYHSGTGLPAELQQRQWLGSQDSSPRHSSRFGNTSNSSLDSRDYLHVLGSVPLPESTHRDSLGQPHQQALPQYMTPEYSDLYHSGTGLPAELQQRQWLGSQDSSPRHSSRFGNRSNSSLDSRDYLHVLGSVPLPESTHRDSLGQPHQQALPRYMTPEYSDLNHSGTGLPAELQWRLLGSQDSSSRHSSQFGNTSISSFHSSHSMPPFSH